MSPKKQQHININENFFMESTNKNKIECLSISGK